MDDAEICALRLIDQSAMCKLYLAVSSGKELNDAVISNVVACMRHNLRFWKDALSTKDNILLCLSTLLSAVKKKLCTIAALLDAMKDADFSLIVSKLRCFMLCCRKFL